MTRRENRENVVPPWRVCEPATVTHALCLPQALDADGHPVPGRAHEALEAQPRALEHAVMAHARDHRTATPTPMGGLITGGVVSVVTRYCVLMGIESSGKENPPAALVTWGFPTLWKPVV